MRSKFIIIPAMLMALGALYAVAATDNSAEEVAWVIGDQPIWKSEIEEAYQNMLYDRLPIQGDPYCTIPEQLAIEKLYLHQAEIDTIEANDSFVMQQVEARLNYFIANLGSKEKVEQVFHKSMPAIRESMIDMVRNQSRVQQVQQQLTKDITTTPSDIRKYFNRLPQDSLPWVPQQVEVQILTVAPAVPREEIDDVKSRLRGYADAVNKGESQFSVLATLYSEDPESAVRGGELGFFGRAEMVPEFTAVAFNLTDPKKASKIVQTEYGYHILQLIEKRGDRVNVRHILLKPRVAEKDLTEAISRMDTLKKDISEQKVSFESAVAYLSQDKNTRNNRGMMVNPSTGSTRFQMSDLPQEVAKVVDKLQPGEVSEPFIMVNPKTRREEVAMVKLASRLEGHKANMSDDYQLIKNLYEKSQREAVLNKWLAAKIKDTYVRIEDSWRNCEFKHKDWIK